MQSVKCHGNRGEFFYKYSLFFLSFSSQYYHQKGGNNSSKIVFYGWYKNCVKIIPSYQQNDFLLLERHEIASKLAIKTIKNIKTGRFSFLNVWGGMSLRQVVGGRLKVASPQCSLLTTLLAKLILKIRHHLLDGMPLTLHWDNWGVVSCERDNWSIKSWWRHHCMLLHWLA